MPKTNQSSNVSAPSDDDKYIQPIIGKMGWDTEYPQLYGMGYSRNNGLDFHVFASFDGLIFNKSDIDNIWNTGVSDRVKKEVDSATSQVSDAVNNANSAVSQAESAVAASKVNSDAIKSMQSAKSDAQASAHKALLYAKAAITDLKDLHDLQAQVTKQSTEISNNTTAIKLKADKTVTDAIHKAVKEQKTELKVLSDRIQTKVTSSDVKGILDNGKYATQDFTQSLVTQTSKTLSTNITEVKNDVDKRMTNLQDSIDGIQNTVKDKANQSTVTQLANDYQIKLNGNSLFDIPSVDLQWTKGVDNDYINIADFEPSKIKKGTRLDLEFDYAIGDKDPDCDFMVQLDDAPWMIWGVDYTHVTKDQPGHYHKIIVADDWSKSKAKHIAIRTNKWKGSMTVTNLTLTSGDNVETALRMLNDDMNLRVSKGDLMSQINLEAGQEIFDSKKLLFNADNIIFGKNSKAFIPDAAITNLSLDKLTAGQLKIPITDQYGNEIVMGNSGINVLSAPEKMELSNKGLKDDVTFKLNISAHGMNLTEHVNYNKDGQHFNPSDNFDFLKMEPDVLHHTDGSSDEVKTPSGITFYVPNNISQDLGPSSPGGFLALGYDETGAVKQNQKGVDVAYVTHAINGWEKGLNVRTMMYMQPEGADHEMRTTWVSWSNWDGGEHYPAIVNGPFNYGGIAFPKSSKVTLFDAYGHAMWPTQSLGTYNGWR